MAWMASAMSLPSASHAGRPIACAMRCSRRSRWIDSAPALKRTTAGRNIAFSVPWCSLRVHAAQAVRERMHAAQPLLERHRALHAGAHHVPARLAVAAVARGALDVRPAALQAVERDAVGRRVDGRRHEGLHAMRDRVHAGGGRQPGRQAERELGVEQRGLGHQVPAVKAELAAVVDDQDRAARHFAAGAGGGGHRNQRRHALADLRRCRLRWWRRPPAGPRAWRRWPRPWPGRCDEPPPTAIRPSQRSRAYMRDGGAHRGFGGVRRRGVEHRVRQAAERGQRRSSTPAARTPASVTPAACVMPTRSHSSRRRCTTPGSRWIWVRYWIWAMAQRGRGGGSPQYAWHPLRPAGRAEARPATRMHRGVPP